MAKGTLYIVATPIGNLGDITQRALEVLGQVDVIAAEDTRRTVKLLNHFGFKAKLFSFHEHSGKRKVEELIALLQEGQTVALVSDAGTPLISDPGSDLIAAAVQNGITTIPIPGACAAIAALSVVPFPSQKFIFEGFLPTDNTRKETIEKIAGHPYTTVLYESPHRLQKTLEELKIALGDRQTMLAKELTKVHETLFYGTISEISGMLEGKEIKGEYVLLIEGKKQEKAIVTDEEIIKELTKQKAKGLTNKEAVQKTAIQLHVNKNRVYQLQTKLS